MNTKNTQPILSIEDVSLTFNSTKNEPIKVLEKINLKLAAKDSLSIVGASGSGKTSLLMLICGVENATEGKIIIKGEDITQMNENQLCNFRAQKIGIVFQNFSLISTMSAFENVQIALDLIGDKKSAEKTWRWLELVGLEKRHRHYPNQLSGGEQQRIALARAFATKPDLLLADEPTGNLDSENSQKIIDLLFALQAEFDTSFILVTHNDQIANRTNKKMTMTDGHLSNC